MIGLRFIKPALKPALNLTLNSRHRSRSELRSHSRLKWVTQAKRPLLISALTKLGFIMTLMVFVSVVASVRSDVSSSVGLDVGLNTEERGGSSVAQDLLSGLGVRVCSAEPNMREVSERGVSEREVSERGVKAEPLVEALIDTLVVAALDAPRSTLSAEERLKVNQAAQEVILSALDSMGYRYELLYRYRWAPTLHLKLSEKAQASLRALPVTALIEPNRANVTAVASSLPYIGADRIHETYDGSGYAVAVIDSPVVPTHSDFGDCETIGSETCQVKQIVNFVDEPIEGVSSTHGTHVAATVGAVAPGVDLYGLNVFENTTNSRITAYDSNILEALDWVIEQKIQQGTPFVAVNLSLGGGAFTPPCYLSAYTSFFEQLYASGVLPIVATGNNAYATEVSSPACVPGAVAIAALLDRSYSFETANCAQQGVEGDIVCFSNKNGLIDLLAPGLSITASGYTLSGTSMAAPHVAGAIALVYQMFTGALTPRSSIDLLKFWSTTALQENARIYSSLNFKSELISIFEHSVHAEVAFTTSEARAIDADGAQVNFAVTPEEGFQVGKLYAILKAAHPDPTTLEVWAIAPDGSRAGGLLGESAVVDGSNINALIGAQVSVNHFHELTGVSASGAWTLEVIDPQARGGHVISASLFFAKADEVSEATPQCQPCSAAELCDSEGLECYAWPEQPDQGFCVATCDVDADCTPGFQCLEQRCLPLRHTQCKGGEVWLYDTCGRELSHESTCAQACVQGACAGGCVSDTSLGCDGDAVYHYDSCGVRGALVETCAGGARCVEVGDSATCSCASRASSACLNGDVYWFDACGAPEEVAVDCLEGEECSNGQCVSLGCSPDIYEQNDTAPTATQLALGQRISGLNFCVDAVDYYQLNLTSGQSYDIETYTERADTRITLYSPAGSRMRFDDDGGDGQGSLISNFTATSASPYTLLVESQDGSVGVDESYQLLVRPVCDVDEYEHNDRVETRRALMARATPYDLTLCDEDWFSVQADVGDELLIETILPQGGDTTLTLLNASGDVVAYNDDAQGLASRVSLTITQTGQYSIQIRAFGDRYGSQPYQLRVQKSEAELCDGVDNDLDDVVDEDLTAPLADQRSGACAGARKVCAGDQGWVEPDYQDLPGYEAIEVSCDGFDNDCDGEIDRGLTSPLGALQSGVCEGALQVCGGARGWLEPSYVSREGYEYVDASCDGVDNDCDGVMDESTPLTPALNQRGVCAGSLKVCAGAQGWVEPDYSSRVNFEASEVSCDGLDNDCDGLADETLPPQPANLNRGVCEGLVKICAGSRGWLEPPYTGQAGYEQSEVSCDGLDNDCDGRVDEALSAPLAIRQAGVCGGARAICRGALGWVEPDYTARSGHEDDELSCDGLDNDCDGRVDEALTSPLSAVQLGVCQGARQACGGERGWLEPDYAIYHDSYEAGEVSCDGLDNDCDGRVDESLDAPLNSAQEGVCAGARQRCDQARGWVESDPNEREDYEADELSCDGLDNDCDGRVDELLDAPLALRQRGACAGAHQACSGVAGWVEPDYTTMSSYEEVELSCDGLDNDCDGLSDEGVVGELAEEQRGVCAGTRQVCLGLAGWTSPHPSAIPQFEADEVSCDGLDNDCDGVIDEALTPPLASSQLGVCEGSTRYCGGLAGWLDPDPRERDGYEATERSCDGLDNDCDGALDESLEAPLAEEQRGVCAGRVLICSGDLGWVEPTLDATPSYEADESSCDTLDNDCDGATDEALDCAPQAGEPQAGEPQAGEPQAGEPQAGEPQAGEPQAGEPQAGEPQAGEPQAGEPQAGESPAGERAEAGSEVVVSAGDEFEPPRAGTTAGASASLEPPPSREYGCEQDARDLPTRYYLSMTHLSVALLFSLFGALIRRRRLTHDEF